MSLIVADTSAIVDYLFRAEGAEALDEIMDAPENELHVPEVCDIEFVSALRKEIRVGTLALDEALLILVDYHDLALRRHGHEQLLLRVLELRDNLSAYEAAFVAVAERLDAPLLTLDRHLARAVRAHTNVHVLP